jgi:hypothetical protein
MCGVSEKLWSLLYYLSISTRGTIVAVQLTPWLKAVSLLNLINIIIIVKLLRNNTCSSAVFGSSNSTVYDRASIAMNCLTRDTRAVGAGQEDNTGCDLRRLTRPSHWGGKLILSLVVHCRGNEWCPHWAWRNCIDSDTASNVLITEPSSERYYCSFCRCIVKEIWTANVCVYASIVDYRGALFHVR